MASRRGPVAEPAPRGQETPAPHLQHPPVEQPPREPITPEVREVVARQLGRPPRALVAVAHRCPCGRPDVVETSPRLEDGTPFPTLYYLTCPRAAAAASRLESAGRMREWQAELATDPELAERYRAAHEAYLAERDARGALPTRNSAGGMPDRVKCLHALAGHALASGPGVNPIGDRAVAEMGEWWANGPCVPDPDEETA
jgi:uncharacterized protein